MNNSRFCKSEVLYIIKCLHKYVEFDIFYIGDEYMANKLYNIFNALSITFWIFVVYVAKEQWTFHYNIHFTIIVLGALIIELKLSGLSLFLAKKLSKEIPINKAEAVESADAVFLPIYTGYFLVAFSVSSLYQLVIASTFIFAILILTRWQFFNPAYLIKGYHCYYITTNKKIKILVICKKELRSPDKVNLDHLHRINNTTYIDI